MEAESELVTICSQLREWNVQAGLTDDFEKHPNAILELIGRLDAVTINVGMLRRTSAGKELNQDWLMNHADERVRNKSRALLRKWKLAAGVSTGASERLALVAAQGAPKRPGTTILEQLRTKSSRLSSPTADVQAVVVHRPSSALAQTSSPSSGSFLARLKGQCKVEETGKNEHRISTKPDGSRVESKLKKKQQSARSVVNGEHVSTKAVSHENRISTRPDGSKVMTQTTVIKKITKLNGKQGRPALK